MVFSAHAHGKWSLLAGCQTNKILQASSLPSQTPQSLSLSGVAGAAVSLLAPHLPLEYHATISTQVVSHPHPPSHPFFIFSLLQPSSCLRFPPKSSSSPFHSHHGTVHSPWSLALHHRHSTLRLRCRRSTRTALDPLTRASRLRCVSRGVRGSPTLTGGGGALKGPTCSDRPAHACGIHPGSQNAQKTDRDAFPPDRNVGDQHIRGRVRSRPSGRRTFWPVWITTRYNVNATCNEGSSRISCDLGWAQGTASRCIIEFEQTLTISAWDIDVSCSRVFFASISRFFHSPLRLPILPLPLPSFLPSTSPSIIPSFYSRLFLTSPPDPAPLPLFSPQTGTVYSLQRLHPHGPETERPHCRRPTLNSLLDLAYPCIGIPLCLSRRTRDMPLPRWRGMWTRC